MQTRTKVLLIAVPLVIVVMGVVTTIAIVTTTAEREPSCFDRLSSGPNSNTSRLDTTLDIPRSEWPEVARLMREFAAEQHWSVKEGVGATDPNFRWLDMCNDAVTTIRAGNKNGDGQKIGFGIVHMTYTGPDSDGWQAFYRDLHARLEARWPGRMRYVEGEFGQVIARPTWLDPVTPTSNDHLLHP